MGISNEINLGIRIIKIFGEFLAVSVSEKWRELGKNK